MDADVAEVFAIVSFICTVICTVFLMLIACHVGTIARETGEIATASYRIAAELKQRRSSEGTTAPSPPDEKVG